MLPLSASAAAKRRLYVCNAHNGRAMMNYRSLLFVPGNRPDRFDKACNTDADLVCIDLEDAVAPDEKVRARQTTLEWLERSGHKNVGLRINALDNQYGRADIEVLSMSALILPFVMAPKVSSGKQMDNIADVFPEGLGALFPVLESATGIRRADEIYENPRVKFSIFGAIDYSADIGSDMEWETMLYARSHLVAASNANDVILFDTPYADVGDPAGCMMATERAKKIGIFARSAIHPTQISPIHSALEPTNDELLQANRIIKAMDEAGGNVALLDGKLLEEPVVKKARRVLAFK